MESAGVDPQKPYSYLDGKIIQEVEQKEEILDVVPVEADHDAKHKVSSTETSDAVAEVKQEEISKTKKPAKKSAKLKAKDK